jgi:hypothetical protein
VQRNKESSAARSRKPHPLSERNENIFRTSHRNAKLAATFQLLAQCLCEGEHDIFFEFSA